MQKPNINKSNLTISYEILGAKGVSSQINMRSNINTIIALLKFKYGIASTKEVEAIRKGLNLTIKSRAFGKLYKENFVSREEEFWKVAPTFHIHEVSKKEEDDTKIKELINHIKRELLETIVEVADQF